MDEIFEINLYILTDDEDGQFIENLAISLIKQLSEMDIHYINRIEAPSGINDRVKGDPITVGGIVLGIGVAALPGLITFLQNWVIERTKVIIEAPNGAKAQFVPNKKLSADEIVDLIKRLNKIKK